jgi:uncharacterized SAM-binding protein YcdF (DUF218 family)
MSDLARLVSYSALLPPMLFLVTALLGAAAMMRWRRVGWAVASLSLVLLYILATPWASSRLLASAERRVPTGGSEAGPAGAIAVLAGDVSGVDAAGGQAVGLLTLDRIYYAARAYRATHLPVITVGGSIGRGRRAMADLMAEVLIQDFGVPVEWRETRSQTTYENGELAAAALRQAQVSTVLVVTQRWHMARAIWAFRRAGMAAIPAEVPPTVPASGSEAGSFLPQAQALLDSFYAAHELLGLPYYELRYGVWRSAVDPR